MLTHASNTGSESMRRSTSGHPAWRVFAQIAKGLALHRRLEPRPDEPHFINRITWVGRVEKWRGGLGAPYRSGPFVGRGFTRRTLLRFHFPLIEPDGRISRIRLSDQDSRVRPRQEAGP